MIVCPYCGKEKIRPIIYGEIGFRDYNDVEEFEKRYFWGGKEKGKNAPDFHCNACDENFSAGKISSGSFGVAERFKIKPGLKVAIVLKKDQKTEKLTEGIVKDILTSKANHPRGIKVRLADGNVGRVRKIL